MCHTQPVSAPAVNGGSFAFAASGTFGGNNCGQGGAGNIQQLLGLLMGVLQMGMQMGAMGGGMGGGMGMGGMGMGCDPCGMGGMGGMGSPFGGGCGMGSPFGGSPFGGGPFGGSPFGGGPFGGGGFGGGGCGQGGGMNPMMMIGLLLGVVAGMSQQQGGAAGFMGGNPMQFAGAI